jgi:hypothetical protein
MATSPTPHELVESLDPDAIRLRLEELEKERDALRVLMRAALARGRRQPPATRKEEVPNGS